MEDPAAVHATSLSLGKDKELKKSSRRPFLNILLLVSLLLASLIGAFCYMSLSGYSSPNGSVEFLRCPDGVRTFSTYPSAHCPTPGHFYECNGSVPLMQVCPEGTSYEPLEERCGKMSNHVVKHRQRRSAQIKDQDTLGRIVNLGNIFYGSTDYVAPNQNLWSRETLKENSLVQDTETSNTVVRITETKMDRANLLDIDASLALSFMGGLVSIKGSAKYLDDRRSKKNSVQVTLNYFSTTKTESITADMKSMINFSGVCDKVGSENGPTHVVTSVTRGFRGIFTFVKTISEDKKDADIGGSLEVVIKALPGIEIEGSASIKFEEKEENITQSLDVKFWGDTILKDSVSTFEDAVRVYKQLGEVARTSNNVVRFGITEIEEYCDNKQAILRSISNSLTESIIKVVNELETLQIYAQTLMSSPAAIAFPNSIKSNLNIFDSKLSNYVNDLKQKLSEILPQVRGGAGGGEKPLVMLLEDYENSAFQSARGTQFLDNRNREIGTINLFMRRRGLPGNGIVVEEDKSSLGNQCRIDFKFLIEFILPVLPEGDVVSEYLGTLQTQSEENKWYNDNTKVIKAGESYNKFTRFYDINQDKEDACFIVSLKKVSMEHDVAKIIIVGPHAEVISSNFNPPREVALPKEIEVSSTEIDYTIEYQSDGVMTHVDIIYQQFSPNSNETFVKISTQFPIDKTGVTQITLKGLSPYTNYEITQNLVSIIDQYSWAVGPPSSTFTITTLASSPPFSLEIKETSENSAVVIWSEPQSVAPNINIVEYSLNIHKQSCNSIPLRTMKSKLKIIDVTELLSAESYCFSVEALSDAPGRKCSVTKKGRVTNLQCIKIKNRSEITATTNPAAPTEMTVTDLTTQSASIGWEAPKIVPDSKLHYVLQYKRVDPSQNHQVTAEVKTFSTKENKADISSLPSGAVFQLRVKIKTTKGDSKYSEPTTVSIPLSPPSNLGLISATDNSVSISWITPQTLASNIPSIQYKIETFQETCSSAPLTILKTTEPNADVSKLSPAGVYCVSVETMAEVEAQEGTIGCLGLGSNQTAKISCTEQSKANVVVSTNPAAPADLNIASITTDTVSLVWDPSKISRLANLLHYKVEYFRVDPVTKEQLIAGSKTSTSVQTKLSVGALASGATYQFRVQVKTTQGASDYSSPITATTTFMETELEQFRKSLNINSLESEISNVKHELKKEFVDSKSETEIEINDLKQTVTSEITKLIEITNLTKHEISDLKTENSNLKDNVVTLLEDFTTFKENGPIGLISAWVPRANSNWFEGDNWEVDQPIPNGWVVCNGSMIQKGHWAGRKTPDLNSGYFLRGGNYDELLELDENIAITTTVSDIKKGRKGEETRPKNMRVMFLMKCW